MHMESLSHVTSYVTFVVFPKIENVELAETDRREAIKFLSEAVVALAGMMKDAIEQGDVEFLDKASKEWRRFGEFWLEGYEYRTNSNDLEYQLASATRDILDKILFVLCAWQLRRLWTDPTDEAALHAFTALASFTNIQRLFDLVISQYRDSGSGLLSNWILGALPQGEVHMIDVDTWMIRALVLIAIRLAPSPGLNLLPCTAPKCREEA